MARNEQSQPIDKDGRSIQGDSVPRKIRLSAFELTLQGKKWTSIWFIF